MTTPSRYKVTHTTRYTYAETVPVCQNIVRLTPRPTASQTCSRHRLTVLPHPTATHRRSDYFGNTEHLFAVDKAHRQLRITSSSTVEVRPREVAALAGSPPWEAVRDALATDAAAVGLDDYQFTFRSPLIPLLPELAAYARPCFAPGRPMLAALADLRQQIHRDFRYAPQTTDVHTTVAEVFARRQGVCQDLAHVLLACSRSLGLAARYVSGYLRTVPAAGKPPLTGADASHAWVSVYCGRLGWIDVDPTNDSFPSADHITLAWGRDYGDVCPVVGMFVGGGAHQLSVAVDVVPLPP